MVMERDVQRCDRSRGNWQEKNGWHCHECDSRGVAIIEPDLEEEIRVVEEFENRLKICCIYQYGRQSGEDNNNNSPKRKDAFDVLMKRNLTKFPCEITKESRK